MLKIALVFLLTTLVFLALAPEGRSQTLPLGTVTLTSIDPYG